MSFHDRADAGRRLAQALAKYRGRDVVVLALPRGGAPVAAEIAEALAAPLDLVLVRKIGAPLQEELAMGAVAEGAPPVTVRNEDVIRLLGVDEAGFRRVLDKELAEMERRRRAYLSGRAAAEVAGRLAILVDDGVATGATTRAALRAVRARRPKKLVLAIPVAEKDVQASLRPECDEVVCLEDHLVWGGVGSCYDDFRQISDAEVTRILARFPPRPEGRGPAGEGDRPPPPPST
jgi:predicted phosphoribosyltransferase